MRPTGRECETDLLRLRLRLVLVFVLLWVDPYVVLVVKLRMNHIHVRPLPGESHVYKKNERPASNGRI